MNTATGAFALIGRSFSSGESDHLYQALVSARAAHSADRQGRPALTPPTRRWRGPGIEIVLPVRLAQ